MKRPAPRSRRPSWPFSHGVVVEGQRSSCSSPGRWPDRQIRSPAGRGRRPGGPDAATIRMRTLLRQAGGDLQHVVEMTVYATSAELMEPAGRVAQGYFTDPLPAQSFIVVKALARPELLVEIRAIAAIPLTPPRRRGRARTAPARRARRRRT